jgi:hypothetical protein
MKNLIRIFLIVVIVGAGISIGSSCSDENDCSLAGRPMMYCTLYTIDEITDLRVNDTLDSLTITALGTDSIILNNQKKSTYADVTVTLYQRYYCIYTLVQSE